MTAESIIPGEEMVLGKVYDEACMDVFQFHILNCGDSVASDCSPAGTQSLRLQHRDDI